jgi:hypothetical protein
MTQTDEASPAGTPLASAIAKGEQGYFAMARARTSNTQPHASSKDPQRAPQGKA